MENEEKMGDEYSVELRVNGKRIGMNAFVRTVFFKVVTGIVSTLKNTDEADEIILTIRR